ncbi:MAG TPA: sigma-E factor negative regulatory protein [SAR86 cluster bacterium]|jgi:hypothetical protein|nr:sigma-E factor negative regulatory protein [SAR86 cluster bacterium]|tara:strand:+ start:5942 stop:6637 length:696 start_codon:yes stop_codon:yes gene_type:complete
MTVSKGIKEKISALSDGELSEFETRRVLNEIEDNAELREYWNDLQISKRVLHKDNLLFEEIDISTRISNELGKKAKIVTSERSWWVNQKNYIGMALASCLVVFFFNFQYTNNNNSFTDLASKRISEAIASPEAIEVLNNSVSGINAELQNIQNGPQGILRANYLMPSSGKSFKVSLSPIETPMALSSSRASRISYIKTEKGIFVISVSGDITAEKKSKILQNANFFSNKVK